MSPLPGARSRIMGRSCGSLGRIESKRVRPSKRKSMTKFIFACFLFAMTGFLLPVEAASPLPSNVEARLLELARDGQLTVRALQGWGLLDEQHRKLILELRSKGKLDALSADGAQIDAWLADAASGKLELTPEQKEGLAQTRELFRQVEALAASSPSGENRTDAHAPAETLPAGPVQSAAGSSC